MPVGVGVAALLVGFVAGAARARGQVERMLLTRAEALARAEARREDAQARIVALQAELEGVREAKEEAARRAVASSERMDAAERTVREQQEFLSRSKRELQDSFEALASVALKSTSAELLRLAQERWQATRVENARELEQRSRGIEALLSPLGETLRRLEGRTGELERAREGAYRGLEEQVRSLREATASLSEKTTTLSSALKGSQAQGRWGEIALRNVVEAAGMSEHVDFFDQPTLDDGKRPDMIVRLPGGRFIAVDAKVPFNAYLEATEATSDAAREQALDRHVAALRDHVRTLSARDYADQVEGDIDLVVLFLPGDPFLSAAFARDPDLQVLAMRSRVLIATPTTLVALLRTVGIYWQQRSITENAEKIAEVARELYDRAALFAEHLARVGAGLDGAVDAFNQAVGSFERRLMPMARRLEELKVLEHTKRRLATPDPVEDEPRSVDRSLSLWDDAP